MNRSYKYLDYSQSIADSLLFLKNAKAEKELFKIKLNEYLEIINSNKNVFLKFPLLTREIQSALTLQQFNTLTVQGKIDELKKLMVKLTYMQTMLAEIEQIKDPVLQGKVSLDSNKTRFNNAADRLVSRTVDTLHFEMQQFEQLFKKAVLQLNDDKQKRGKVRSLMGQDLPVISQFPVIETELRKIMEGEAKGGIGADYVITNYASIGDSLNKLIEFARYFSRLSSDYMLILTGYDLGIFQTIKDNLSLANLSAEFIKLNSKAIEYKNKMIKLDTLRSQADVLRKQVNDKIGDLSVNHQNYIRDEIVKIQELLVNKLGSEFERAEAKINTIREILKKEFRTNDQRATDMLYIRQSIARYENNLWQEDLAVLYEELNDFVSGKSAWTRDEFSNATQRYIKERNESLELTKTHFELFFTKNRDYKNRFEKIANTKSSKKELKKLLNEMNSFKPLKSIFYKFIK